jgi:glucose-1-phosphate cytidylyltransferase
LSALLETHERLGKSATVTAVRPVSRFGALEIDDLGGVNSFAEKPLHEGWINGGFFILEPQVFGYLTPDQMLEEKPMEMLASSGELGAYLHTGFWQPMDTFRESQLLNQLWEQNKAPWKNW